MTSTAESLKCLGVVGAGAMGAGIAQIGLTAGFKVILHDANKAMLTSAREQILSRIARLVEKGSLSEEAARTADQNLILAEDISAFAPAEVVIEAIVEKLQPKQSIFAAIEKIVGPETVLATNTSSLSVAAIARGCQRRDRVCGMHFFNPVPVMKLVEVIGAPDTSETTMALAEALSKRLGKVAVRVKDVPGFLVNLLGRAYTTEALHIQLEGAASVEAIDRIMREGAGFRMGPFELMDLTGIDVNFPATNFIYQGFQHEPRLKTTILHESLFNAGRYGRKTGQGYHSYAEGTPAAAPAAQANAPDSFSVCALGDDPALAALMTEGLRAANRDQADALLIAPVGEDAATACARLELDPARVVAIDFSCVARKFLTLMAPLGGNGCVEAVAACLRAMGYTVAVIGDSPGFVAPRILSMIANLGCEVAQMGIGTPQDIDLSMKLAQNYPRGPLEWAEFLGPARVYQTLAQLQNLTGSDRYRPSLWLRRRVQLGFPIHKRS